MKVGHTLKHVISIIPVISMHYFILIRHLRFCLYLFIIDKSIIMCGLWSGMFTLSTIRKIFPDSYWYVSKCFRQFNRQFFICNCYWTCSRAYYDKCFNSDARNYIYSWHQNKLFHVCELMDVICHTPSWIIYIWFGLANCYVELDWIKLNKLQDFFFILNIY